jgi:hypothetical protein
MSLRHWLLLIALCVVGGALQVTWRNTIVMKGYRVGERLANVQAAQTRVRWLIAQVEGLESPVHLAAVSEQRKLGLVAWSTLPDAAATAPPTALQLATVPSDTSD